jgi:hypothetical protein
LPPSEAQGHLKSVHGSGSNTRLDLQKMDHLVDRYSLRQELPIITPGEAREPYQGLEVLNGLRCLYCPKVLGKEDSMKKHHQKNHLEEHPTPSQWLSCHMQQLSARPGQSRQYFEVIPPKTVEAAALDTMIKDLCAKAEATLKVDMSSINARSVSPWLLITNWHTHILPYNTEELWRLIAVPKETEFPGLKTLIMTYMQEATKKIAYTGELTLQHLNTPNPDKT